MTYESRAAAIPEQSGGRKHPVDLSDDLSAEMPEHVLFSVKSYDLPGRPTTSLFYYLLVLHLSLLHMHTH